MDFSNIKNQIEIIKPQNKEGDLVVKKKAGRPKRPEQMRITVRIPSGIHSELKEFTSKAGINKSAFIVYCVKYMMADETTRNKFLVKHFI